MSAAYSDAILSSVTPSHAAEIVRRRINQAETLNSQLADYVSERSAIEKEYAERLQALNDKYEPTDEALGILRPVWKTVSQTVGESAVAAQQFGEKLQTLVAQTFREYESTEDWVELKKMHESMTELARKMDEADEETRAKMLHAFRSKHKPSDESRIAWSTQAPVILEKVQHMDEARLGLIKQNLTSVQTMQVDKASVTLTLAEKSLDSILSLEPRDVIKTFAAEVTAGVLGTGHEVPIDTSNTVYTTNPEDEKNYRAFGTYDNQVGPTTGDEDFQAFGYRNKGPAEDPNVTKDKQSKYANTVYTTRHESEKEYQQFGGKHQNVVTAETARLPQEYDAFGAPINPSAPSSGRATPRHSQSKNHSKEHLNQLSPQSTSSDRSIIKDAVTSLFSKHHKHHA
ncbi:hypothetical protein TRVA0_022S01222 [Trichomonascus vanleenenianus]|uniref:uncharacterized protein n=1 Tax=Trichomonascus vanleenenianus TaxID=2268995 RepID=UPI003ECABB42